MTEAAERASDDSALDAITTPKLWAGKYQTPEELEEGYRNSLKVFNENRQVVSPQFPINPNVKVLGVIPNFHGE